MIKPPPEKLGSFYLGAVYNRKKNELSEEIINYDARDLTTHAICVGMTGSGKTGLCIDLLEEAALDKVPAIIIDPKGDMTNLLLQFENLSPDDFRPWINSDDASRKNMSVEEFAAATAKLWKDGLAKWGQDGNRIAALKNSVEYRIYTPGSDAGIPVNIMGSFAAPDVDFDKEAEMLRERIQGTVAALLGMIGNDEDPVRSREGILLATIFEHYWRKGEDLDLSKLILSVQTPPVEKLGVFDVDTFFPEKDRFNLAMEFNALVASPQFSNWLRGDPLDIDKIYFTADGKPRHSIFYIAHLSESERMFFVTLLLNSLVTWMRRQSGTSSLRSLVYFDEIFGYFPPTANPPAKKPLLTILKQARAYGLGAILVTQNPVDIDYKGLSNAGTWFIGKLQTDRDKERVLDGLKGAIAEAGTTDQFDFDEIISALSSRVFLYHNVHEDHPIVFHTRWAMSYLRGPLTRPQLRLLVGEQKPSPVNPVSNGPDEKIVTSTPEKYKEMRPSLDPSVEQRFFAVWKSESVARVEMETEGELLLRYEPMILCVGKVRFYNAKRDIDQIEEISVLAPPPDAFGRVDWDQVIEVQDIERSLLKKPDHPENIKVVWGDIPGSLNSSKEINKVKKEFSDYLYREKEYPLYEHEELEMYQKPGESVESFQLRIMQEAREERDDEIDKIQDRYETKFERISDRIRREENKLETQKADLRHRKTAEIVGVAETIFSVFSGRRRRSISSVTTKSRMRRKVSQNVESIEEELEDLHEDYRELEHDLEEQFQAIKDKWDAAAEGITRDAIKPRRTDVRVDGAYLIWQPVWESKSGSRVSARG